MRININVTGYVTLAAGTITGIEKLDFGSSEAVVALDSSAFASVDGFQIINGGATNKFNSLVILGAEVDLSAVSLVNWTTSEVITYDGTAGDDQLTGSSVTDTFFGTVGADTIDGGDGIDSINYDQSTSGVTVSLAAGTGSGGHSDGDVLSNIENLTGSSHDDRLTGESGDNYLVGGGGNDRFVGGNGQDRYTGGTGDDIFVFSNVNHSRVGDNIRDQIDDFSQLPGDDDQIDVNNIDAQVTSTATNEAFTFIGTAAFSGEGQIRVVQSGNDTVVEFNTTGNDSAEMEILLLGFTATNVSAGDFVL